jgi:hypothetical protein
MLSDFYIFKNGMSNSLPISRGKIYICVIKNVKYQNVYKGLKLSWIRIKILQVFIFNWSICNFNCSSLHALKTSSQKGFFSCILCPEFNSCVISIFSEDNNNFVILSSVVFVVFHFISLVWFGFMVFNATFNNISVILA